MLKCVDEGKAEGTSAYDTCISEFITPKASFCQQTRGLAKGSAEDTKCQEQIKFDIKNLPTEKGADYCYLSYFWDDQYDLLYTCLIA